MGFSARLRKGSAVGQFEHIGVKCAAVGKRAARDVERSSRKASCHVGCSTGQAHGLRGGKRAVCGHSQCASGEFNRIDDQLCFLHLVGVADLHGAGTRDGFAGKRAVFGVQGAVNRDSGELALGARGLAVGAKGHRCAFAHVDCTVSQHQVVGINAGHRVVRTNQHEFRAFAADEKTILNARYIHKAHRACEVVSVRDRGICRTHNELRVGGVRLRGVLVDQGFARKDSVSCAARIRIFGRDAVGNVDREFGHCCRTVEENFKVACVVGFKFRQNVACQRERIGLVVKGDRANV